MYILDIASAIKRITINERRDFIFGNYYKRFEFVFNKQVIIKSNA